MAEELQRVKSIDGMDDETFVKHFNARHLGDIGLKYLMPGGEMGYMRAFHRRIHKLGHGSLPHVHNDPKPKQKRGAK
jgi:hypothetical protein